jgi:hypothetical protein
MRPVCTIGGGKQAQACVVTCIARISGRAGAPASGPALFAGYLHKCRVGDRAPLRHGERLCEPQHSARQHPLNHSGTRRVARLLRVTDVTDPRSGARFREAHQQNHADSLRVPSCHEKDSGARDLSRRNVSTAEMTPQNSKASFTDQHPCGVKSALVAANRAGPEAGAPGAVPRCTRAHRGAISHSSTDNVPRLASSWASAPMGSVSLRAE